MYTCRQECAAATKQEECHKRVSKTTQGSRQSTDRKQEKEKRERDRERETRRCSSCIHVGCVCVQQSTTWKALKASQSHTHPRPPAKENPKETTHTQSKQPSNQSTNQLKAAAPLFSIHTNATSSLTPPSPPAQHPRPRRPQAQRAQPTHHQPTHHQPPDLLLPPTFLTTAAADLALIQCPVRRVEEAGSRVQPHAQGPCE